MTAFYWVASWDTKKENDLVASTGCSTTDELAYKMEAKTVELSATLKGCSLVADLVTVKVESMEIQTAEMKAF